MPDIVEDATPVLRTRRTPAQMAAARVLDAAPDAQIQEMRQRAQERKLAQASAATQAVKSTEAKLVRWLYNSNTDNISEFPETYLIIEDGYFEYTPPANFPMTDEDRDTHIEFCRARVNTKAIDGMANAKAIRNTSDAVIAQTQFLPPQPQQMSAGVLTINNEM